MKATIRVEIKTETKTVVRQWVVDEAEWKRRKPQIVSDVRVIVDTHCNGVKK